MLAVLFELYFIFFELDGSTQHLKTFINNISNQRNIVIHVDSHSSFL